MSKCKCWHETPNRKQVDAECWGTRERDACSCGGDQMKCDFYPEIRVKVKSKPDIKPMIVAKTKMTRLPETCKKCSLSQVEHYGFCDTERYCGITNRACPTEKKQSGNVGYGKPDWCPLICWL